MEQSDRYIERGRSLVNLSRYKEAAVELEKALLEEPQNIDALMLACISYINMGDMHRANEHTDKLLATAPDLSVGYYYKAICASRADDNKTAETHIRQALNIDPNEADYWAVLSAVYIDRKEWDKALEYSDEGLACDPENTQCLNHRTLCLTKLNRLHELESNIGETLSNDPYNAYTQSNVGWSKLETGDHEAAKLHFMESLRINPNSEYARSGMINAIKAKNFLFRWFLQYSFWISNKKDSMQWAIMIGFVIGRRIIFSLAGTYPFLYPVGMFLLFLAYITWLVVPITNFFLLTDRFGRNILSRDEKLSAGIAGIAIIGALASVTAAWFTNITGLWYLAIYLAVAAIPLSRHFGITPEKRSIGLTLFTMGIAVSGLLAVIMAFMGMEYAENLGGVFILSFAVYTWVGNGLLRK